MGLTLIGLAGYAQVGKDSTADVLKGEGFKRLAFADQVRLAVYRLNPQIVDLDIPGHKNTVKHIVDHVGWDEAKQIPEIRRLLQVMGTEVGRDMFGSFCWVDLTMRQLQHKSKVVITDVRFPNEADEVKKFGGRVFRVTRPGYNAINNHASETALDKYEFDGVIENNGTLDELRDTVRIALNLI